MRKNALLGVESGIWVGGPTAKVVGEALGDLRSRHRTSESGDLVLGLNMLQRWWKGSCH
jgi:hypothetical protein